MILQCESKKTFWHQLTSDVKKGEIGACQKSVNNGNYKRRGYLKAVYSFNKAEKICLKYNHIK